jgi:glycosyltransferase involved in cell wall biosynthesis
MRLAYFSPLPPAATGIADYSGRLLPALAQWADVTLFCDSPPPPALAHLPHYPTRAYPARRWQTHLPLYQMGNSAHHHAMYALALRYPGVVVLHENGLHHMVADGTAAVPGRYHHYVRHVGYAQGPAGVDTAVLLPQQLATLDPFAEPLNQRLLDSSLGVIVHSDYVREKLHHAHPNLPCVVIPHLDYVGAYQPQSPARTQLNLPVGAFVVASGGLLTANKRLDVALRAFAQLRTAVPHAHYLLVGELMPDVNLTPLLDELGLQGTVTAVGRVDGDEPFMDYLATADVLINLRQPTVGETSGVAMIGMGLGLPVVLFDHGWYGELPEGTAVKVPVMDEAALAQSLIRLATDERHRHAVGQAGRAYVREMCQPAAVAAQYGAFIGRVWRQLVGEL